ncbi:MAG TPA: type VI secretion system tip protein TssI/VgrG [Polyangiaceae bacterium]|nr:type VI secretion system tip protein TssI/VgrG [Polyangiaceae bacterium]
MRHLLDVRIESSAFDTGTVLVAELRGRESISRLFELEVRVVTGGEALDEDALLTSATSIVFERRDAAGGATQEARRISGVVREIRDRSLSESQHREYVLTLVPRVWQSTLTSTSDVCMDMTVPDIIQKKLVDSAGLEAGKDVELRLKSRYEPREFVVQYKETNLAFACRLAEDLGIHFFFEEGPDGREVMVFADDNSAFKPSAPASSAFTTRGERALVFELEARRKLVPKAFAARDYNYRNPAMDLLGEAQVPALGTGKIDEYGPHAKTPAEATFYAKIRAEEANARSLEFEGKSDLPGLRAGSVVKLEGHPRGDLELVIVEVDHHVAQNVAGFGDAKHEPYENTFRAILKATTYRPARVTPKPVVHGVVTGLVEAASPTELGAIDDQGRYRVMFMYDSVTGRGDGKASRPLRMAQPSAGASRGFHLPLKTGTEVIITCVNGDPDRPIIAGAVPNPQTPSPVTSANSEKSMWKTNATSIAMDDDKPRCKVSVNGDEHVFQIGEPNGPELGFFSGTTANAASMANGASTVYSSTYGAYHEYKTAVAASDIVNVAGIPHPWSLWKKIDAVSEAALGFVKGMSQLAGTPSKIRTTFLEKDKREADEKYAKMKEELATKLGVSAEPRLKDNDDGTQRWETADETRDRGIKEELARPENAKLKTDLQDAQTAAETAAKELKEEQESWEKSPLNVETGATGDIIKTAEQAKAAVKTAAKLISTIAEVFEKAAQKAEFVAMQMAQAAEAKDTLRSGERHAANVGTFDTHFNIQGATNSIGIEGGKNAILFGGFHANVYSMGEAALVGNRSAHVKSPKLVEIASSDVVLSAKKTVDVHSVGTLKLVAHPDDKSVAIPGEHKMYLHSKEGILLDTVEKNIDLKAKTSVTVTAEDEDFTLKAKKNIKVRAEEEAIEITAAKGKFDILAHEGDLSLRAKKKVVVQSFDGDFTVVADKGKGTLKTSKELNLDCKSGSWKASGNLELKLKKLIVNGSKIELG